LEKSTGLTPILPKRTTPKSLRFFEILFGFLRLEVCGCRKSKNIRVDPVGTREKKTLSLCARSTLHHKSNISNSDGYG
jgi:hypothetical protein